MRNNLRLRMKRVMGAALLLLSVGIVSANTLSLESNNDVTWNVNFTSDADIGGFQFDVDDVTVNSATGGEAAANGFFMSNSPTTVLGFSLSGSTIPAGSGTLVVVNVTGTPSGLSGIVMSDAVGNQLDFTYLPSEGDGPADFAFNSSILQAFYFFNLVLINDIEVDPNDWVGAFNGDVCVGARKWDTSLCGGGICDIPVMGDDGSEFTAGYMNTGEFPTFKIYDSSENIYYDAIPSEEVEWSNNGFNLIEVLSAYSSIQGCMDQEACNYNPNATEDEGSCVFAEENYDCDGNCVVEIDCTGECGGSAIVDECGVCGGDGSDDQGCGCFEPGPSGCDNTCGSTLENDECGVCNGPGAIYECGCTDIADGACDCSGNVNDECGVCGGDGIPDGDCDCYGNVDLGCGCGETGPSGCDNICGSTAEVDECGECGGDGIAYGDCDCYGNVDLGCGCGEAGPLGCDNACGSTLENDECGVCGGDGIDEGACDCAGNVEDCAGECDGSAVVDECGECGGSGANIACWDGSYACEANDCPDELDECMDDPNICIWNSVYNNYDNQEDCETNGGLWGGYLEYFNTSCEEMVNLENGCDTQILYWTISALCPASCGVCCDDEDACNPNGEGNCEYAEENYDCDGNCIVEIDCEEVCGGSAIEDECGDCGGDGVEQECGCGSLGEFGIPDGDCDCEGNVELGCGCGELGPSGCDETCGSTLENDECGICGGDGSSCGVNEAPIINAVSDTTILEDAGSQTISLSGIGDGDADVTQSLTVTATSSNTSLIPNLTVTYTSDNATGSLAYTPVSDINGTAVITVTVTDNGGTTNSGVNAQSITFTVTVVAVNDEPSFTKGSNITILEDSGSSSTSNWATSISTGPSDESGQTLTFAVSNNNNSLFSSQPAISSSGTLTFTPADNANGSATVTISLSDNGGTANGGDDTYPNQTFTITVNAVDCAGVPNGTAVVDNCGTCDSDSSNDCVQDCAGEWGGSLVNDECGVCDGNDSTCIPPEEFQFNSSTLQAFYLFNLVLINDIEVESNDWVGAFNGDVCVGARQWDTSQCGSGICDVPVMGDDGNDFTEGYMQNGDIPTFKIYDTSEDTYYDAIPSEEFPWENFGFNFADNLNGFILGCTNMSACNYNADATLDDGSCELPQGCNVWCSGDEGEPQELDCAGECGGSAVVDECEVCIGDGPLEGYTCDGIPELFTFNQSTQQAFYYFYAVTLNGDNVEADDWVGAFNGDICVGARQWDTSLCGSGICDVPVMGDNGYPEATGYMQSGDIPTFKVFNAANNEYFDALASEDIAWENNNLALLNSLQGGILGCTDESACNADESTTVEDGSCIYPEENYDCDGNCLVDIDCEDVCGGMAIEDECGICEGTGPEEGFSCDGTPIDFVYNQSSIQAFYYIYETSDLTGDPLTAEDWVGVFNGETCVGSRQWDTSQCNSSICDVPAMGNDGNEYSDGYLNEGDMPGFKIYDASEGEYFDVYPYPENYAFEVNTAFTIDELVFDFSYSIPLHQYNNLISFYVLPQETEVSSVMMDIQDNINLVIGEATSAQYDGEYWTGSLMNLDISSSYWLRLENADTLDGSGHPLNPDWIYNLHSGANLVSFPSPGSVGISEGLPDDIEDHVLAVIGEGVSAQYDGDTWTGSLMDFKGLHGYWIITDSEISFSYDLDTETLSRKSNPYKVAKNPQGFEFVQSPHQAFYFVDNVELLEGKIEKGDWIISYCGNTVTGSRLWLGRTVDIPVMGAEGTPVTAGYCEANDTPNFKLFKSASQELISLHADIPKWQSNGIFQLNALMESAPIPTEYGMGSAYPNPFNPITQIGYETAGESHIEISVFDLRGQKVATLVNEFTKPGAYSTTWDAAKISSGVYFVHFTATGESIAAVSQIQKLMLVK